MAFSKATLADLQRGQFRAFAPSEQLVVLANMRDRYGALRRWTGTKVVTGTATNGVTYSIAGLVRVTIIGGDPRQAVRVDSLSTLRDYLENIDLSVAGVNALPIAYTLRYASNNAPAKVGAIANLVDQECFRARRVKVTLNSIHPTVADWCDEELFGSIKVVNSGNKASGMRTLWSRSASQAVSGRQGVTINVNESATFNFNAVVNDDTEDEVEIERGARGVSATAARASRRDRRSRARPSRVRRRRRSWGRSSRSVCRRRRPPGRHR